MSYDVIVVGVGGMGSATAFGEGSTGHDISFLRLAGPALS